MDAEVQEQNSKAYFQNCVTFNGIVITEPILVGDNFVAISIEGENKEEFPIVILESSLEVAKENVPVGSKISAFGFLQKNGDDWVVMCKQISIN